MSNATFKLAIGNFVEKANGNAELIVRKVALQILASVIQKSPVDTGRFRGNWMVQVSIDPQTTEALDKSGSKTLAAGSEAISRFKVGQTIFILNHLPYSIELENGSSKQAPLGIVRITAAEFEQYLKSQAA